MRDVLIRYLLGELDEPAQRRLEQRLAESPELERELEHLRSCFSAANEPEAPVASDPPSGLAQRTSHQVSGLAGDSSADVRPASVASDVEPPSGTFTWNLADVSVAAGVFLAVSMLLLPALGGSREIARKNACAENLRQCGRILARHASDNGGRFPGIELRDYAGIFASMLVENGQIESQELKPVLLCRASKQGDAAARGKLVLHIPQVEELRSAQGRELDRLLRQMIYSYAYRVGYFENNKYNCERKRKPSCEPIMADAISFDAFGRPYISSHGGRGFNLLHEDGRVTYHREMSYPGDVNLFVNLLGQPAAGRGKRDIVLVGSDATPGVAEPALNQH